MFRKIFLVLLLLLAPAFPSSAHAQAVGAVYAMTDAADGNAVLVYDRAADGLLTFRGSYPTGGFGIGAATEPVDALGAQSPLLLSPDGRWLLTVNAGSDEISVFRVLPDGLALVHKVPSGGDFPASLTLRWNLVYVLNSGNDGNITGFTLDHDGHLFPLAGSTRSLGAGGTNPPSFIRSPAQVGFTPKGDALVVTLKNVDEQALIEVFALDAGGRPSPQPATSVSHGGIPFGFGFDHRGRLLVAEPFGAGSTGEERASAVSSYEIREDGSLAVVSGSVPNDQTATCWLVTDGRFAYTTNNGTSTVSRYRVAPDGTLTLLDAGGIAAVTGERPVDLALSGDGRFLYNVNAGAGTISLFAIDPDSGALSALGEIGGLPIDAGAVGIAVR